MPLHWRLSPRNPWRGDDIVGAENREPGDVLRPPSGAKTGPRLGKQSPYRHLRPGCHAAKSRRVMLVSSWLTSVDRTALSSTHGKIRMSVRRQLIRRLNPDDTIGRKLSSVGSRAASAQGASHRINCCSG